MTPDLRALQRQFQDGVLGRRSNATDWAAGDTRADAAQRLGIYVDAYRLRLLEALGKDFPGVRGLLGAAEFERVGRGYVDAHPSGTASVRWFGRRFATFLRRHWPARPELEELAEFEWLQGEVFDAADGPTMHTDAVEAVRATAWPSMRLVFQPALRRVDLRWNVVELWRAVRDGQPIPAPSQLAEPAHYLLWRRELNTHWRPLDHEEAMALDAALGGATFGEICERLAGDDAPLAAASLLKRWVTDGLLRTLQLASNPSLKPSGKGVGWKSEDRS